jgi:SPP1 gp7 family putative phage head morphogenesis protein
MVGILEYANYANTKEQTAIFWKHTIMPKKRAIDAILTMRIQQLSFDPLTIFEADANGVEALRVDELQRSQTMLNYVTMGIPVNQLINAFDLPFDEVEGGDVSRTPTGASTPVGESGGDSGAGAPKGLKSGDVNKAELRTAHWKAFDRKISGYEERMAAAVRSFFRSQKKRVLKNLEDNVDQIIPGYLAKAEPNFDINIILRIDKEQQAMRRATDEFISGAYYDFAVTVGRQQKPNFAFNLQDPRAVDWIDKKQLKLVKEVTDYTRERLTDDIVESIQEAVKEGLSRGETLKAISERIDATYQLANDTRSTRIAQTEIVSASNAGSMEALKQLGVEEKEWISSRDSRVRETHESLDGDVVPRDQKFVSSSGAALAFPGDPDAPPEEVINCRCTIVGVNTQETGL